MMPKTIIKIIKRGQGLFWYLFFRLINKEFYLPIPKNLLLVNWVFQRVFNINGSVPTSVHYTSVIQGFQYMKLGKGVERSLAVSGGCYIAACDGASLEIGDGTIWAFNICIQTTNHDFIDRSVNHKKAIKIGKNCWIGNGVAILAGVQLGDNVTIGANSVVTKSFASNVIIAGVPAKIIGTINGGT